MPGQAILLCQNFHTALYPLFGKCSKSWAVEIWHKIWNWLQTICKPFLQCKVEQICVAILWLLLCPLSSKLFHMWQICCTHYPGKLSVGKQDLSNVLSPELKEQKISCTMEPAYMKEPRTIQTNIFHLHHIRITSSNSKQSTEKKKTDSNKAGKSAIYPNFDDKKANSRFSLFFLITQCSQCVAKLHSSNKSRNYL